MSKKLYEESNIASIAAAIRAKNGSQDTYTTAEMADAIDDIETGGILITKTISENGTYNALLDDNADGYSQVVVNISAGTSGTSHIIIGTNNPTSNVGNNGDIFLKYLEFTKLESLSTGSDGGIYFVLPFKSQKVTEYEIVAQYTQPGRTNDAIYGGRTPYAENGIFTANSQIYHQIKCGGPTIPFDTNLHTYKLENNILYTDNVSGNMGGYGYSDLYQLLFGWNNEGNKTGCPNLLIQHAFFTADGVEYKYFPVIKDNEYVLYEQVSGSFLQSEGTGSLIPGNVIGTDRYILDSFCKVNGTWIKLNEASISDVNL